MKLMFAGLDIGQWENIRDIAHYSKYMLSSYLYLRDTKHADAFELMMQRNREDNFMLDSGAFTLMTSKKMQNKTI